MKYTLLLLFVAIVCSIKAQPGQYSSQDAKAIKLYESGKDHYAQLRFSAAQEDLAKAIERDPRFIEPNLILYQVHMEQGQYIKATAALERAVAIDDQFFPNALCFLGDLLVGQGRYQEAEGHLRRFIALDPLSEELTKQARRLLNNSVFAQQAMANPVPFEPVNMGKAINSPQPEYYPCITTDDATFLFTRLIEDPNAYEGVQEDLLLSSIKEGEWSDAAGVFPINTVKNEGAATLSPDGQILIFTACELHGDWGPNRSGVGSCDLFYSMRKGGRWSPPRNMGQPINTVHWESQPSMAADGKTLYFIRGRRGQGGITGMDIYVSELQANGEWGRPRRLPRVINTEYDEESVMIHPDGRTLYFSSRGHTGMGGLDIFMTQKDDDGLWSTPKNLGYPINTHNDENSLLVSSAGDVAFFASDRDGGFGDLDLYSFALPEALRPDRVNFMTGVVVDAETGEPVEAELNFLKLSNGDAIAGTYSDASDGSFLLSLPTGRELAMNAAAQGYLFYSENFSLDKSSGNTPHHLRVELQPIKSGTKVVLDNVFFDTDKFDLRPESKVELDILVQMMQDQPELRVEVGGHTDNVGSAADNKTLSSNRANSVKGYLASKGILATRIETKGYGAEQPIATNETPEGRAQNRRVELKVL